MSQPTSTESCWKKVLRFDVPVLAYAGLIFWLSSQTLTARHKQWLDSISDDLPHALEFGLLALLVLRQWWASRRVRKLEWALALSFFISVSYAFFDEWHQSFVPGRFMDPRDIVADALGAAVFLGLTAGYLLKKKKLTL